MGVSQIRGSCDDAKKTDYELRNWQCFQVFPFWDFLNGMIMQMLNICCMILVQETKTCLLLWRWICMALSCCTAATAIVRVSAGLLLRDLNLMPFTAEATLLCVTQDPESNFHSAQSVHDIWNKDCSKCERHKEEPPCTHGFYTVSSPPLALPYKLWRFVCCSSVCPLHPGFTDFWFNPPSTKESDLIWEHGSSSRASN